MHTPRKTLRGLGALGTLIVFVLFLILLGILWVATGGPQRPLSHAGPFLKPPVAPSVEIGLGRVQGSSFEADSAQIEDIETDGKTLLGYFFGSPGSASGGGDSPYSQYVSLYREAANASNPNEEYVRIETARDLTRNITVTGWVLESKSTAIKAPIGSAAQIPLLGGVSSETPVSVGPDAVIYVTTGRSPNGTSFRVNTCTGYFEQHQDFRPALREDCPDPEEEALKNPQKTGTNVACIDFIDRVSACELFSETIPFDVGTQCRDFILNDLTYNGCVTAHRNDPDFYKSEWRIFLNRQQELWGNTHDQIRLWDENGKLIDSLTY